LFYQQGGGNMLLFNVKEAPNKNKEKRLTETIMNSDEEALAKAIQDMLNNDKKTKVKPKKTKNDKQEKNKEELDKE